MDFFLLMVEQHGPLIISLFVSILDDGGCAFLGLVKDGFLHLLDPFLNASCYHLDIMTNIIP